MLVNSISYWNDLFKKRHDDNLSLEFRQWTGGSVRSMQNQESENLKNFIFAYALRL